MLILQNIDYGIVFDFGHGGSDSGSIWFDNTKEKDYVLTLGLKVIKIIEKYIAGFLVIRTNDVYISIEDRAKMINEYAKKFKKVDVYSLHTNAFNKKASGIEILLSISNVSNDNEWSINFMKEYSKKFKIPVRGIVKKESTKNPGFDFYGLMRLTNSNVKSKILELGFGDYEKDGIILINNIDEIAYFIAQKIAERKNIIIKNNDSKKDYEKILKEVSNYSNIWIDFVNKYHSPTLNLKGLIEKLYFTNPK